MKLSIFTVQDKAAEAFLPPFFARSRGEAIRSFSNAVLDSKHQFFSHRADYVLYSVGTFDDVSGVVSGDLERVLSALECFSDD